MSDSDFDKDSLGDPSLWIDGSRGEAKSADERRAEIRARLADSPESARKPWIRLAEFEAAGRPYLEWFGRSREDIWPELLDSDGIPIPSVYTGCKIGQVNISMRDASERNPGEGKRISPGFRATMNNPVPSVQCTYVKPGGERCGQWSMKGLSVCYIHGGKTKVAQEQAAAVIDAARMRLFGVAEDAIGVLETFVRSSGTPDAIRLKAATEVLDRVGIRGGVEFDVAVEHKLDPSVAVLANLNKLSENQRKAIDSGSESGIIDAEVIIETDDGDTGPDGV